MKKKVLVDAKLICEPPDIRQWGKWDAERYASDLEKWVKDFHDFIRDHRSQDPVYLGVERQYEERCSYCQSQWEEDGNGCPVCCNEAVEEWERDKRIQAAHDEMEGRKRMDTEDSKKAMKEAL